MHRKKKIPVSFILAFIVSFLLAVSLAVMVPKFVPLTKQFQGMIFFGGHFSKKKREDAKSKAWISLLEDCIVVCDGVKYYPQYVQVGYDEFGKVVNTAILHDLHANSATNADLEKVTKYEP